MSHILRQRASHDQRNPRQGGVVISLGRVRASREAAGASVRPSTPCGHDRHVGSCPACQRAQLARWRAQLAAVAS